MTMNQPVENGSAGDLTTPAWIDAAGLTNVGRERPWNEDAYLIANLQRSMVVHDASPAAARGWFAGSSAGTLLVVADGMGGQGGGDVREARKRSRSLHLLEGVSIRRGRCL
jgi:serine/threonine protein phosphatase PrpC